MLVKGGGRVLALGVGRADQTGGSAASADGSLLAAVRLRALPEWGAGLLCHWWQRWPSSCWLHPWRAGSSSRTSSQSQVRRLLNV